MKSKFTTVILFFTMIILIAGVGIIGYAILSDLMGEDIIEKIGTYINESPSEENNDLFDYENYSISESIQGVSNNTNGGDIENYQKILSKYFYNQLNTTQKNIYDKLDENKSNLKYGNFVINYGNEFSDILSSENGDEILGDDYQTAIEAFTHDNPDLYYLDVNKMYLNIKTTKRLFIVSYEVYISPEGDGSYLSSDFQNPEQIETDLLEIERIKNSVLNSLSGNNYQKIKTIHDYLVDNIEYDTNYNAVGTYGLYGALIGKKCVCEGYAKAFKYLTNAAGFDCEIMQGTATNSTGVTENHAWNCIKLDDTWYEVDPTWDDPIITGLGGKIIAGIKSNSIKYKYFLKGVNTFNKEHIANYQFSDGGKIFSYPTISDIDYK